MSAGATSTLDPTEIREILRGAVDLYVHSNPELLPRRLDDIAMANELKAEGFRAAMIWNQFSHTGERAALAKIATGFDMRGSIVLNGTVGGLDPTVVEYAIRMGACYVSMPTMSGAAYQARMSDYAREAATLAGRVPVVDDSGAVLPAVHDVLDVVTRHDVVFGLGYLDQAEGMAVLQAARDHRVRKIAVLRPFSILGLTEAQVEDAMATSEVFLQFPSSSLRGREGGRPASAAQATAAAGIAAPAIAAAIKRYGAERCVLMSDTGWNELTALQWLTLGASTLAEAGIGPTELRTLVYGTPARLIGVE